MSLQWPHLSVMTFDRLFKRLCEPSKKISKFCIIVNLWGYPRSTVVSPYKGPVTRRSFHVTMVTVCCWSMGEISNLFFSNNNFYFTLKCLLCAIDHQSFALVMAWRQYTKNVFWNKTLRPEPNGRHFQTIFSNAFSWKKILIFWLKFRWSLLIRIQSVSSQLWSR